MKKKWIIIFSLLIFIILFLTINVTKYSSTKKLIKAIDNKDYETIESISKKRNFNINRRPYFIKFFATATEQWNLPNGVGAIILTIAVIATVIMDLDGILKVLNKIGPIIIVTILAIAVISTLRPVEPFQSGLLKIDSGNYEIAQVGNNNPVASGVSYAGFVILWFAPFISEIGSKNKLGEVNKGMLLSAVAIFGTATICCIALIANILRGMLGFQH